MPREGNSFAYKLASLVFAIYDYFALIENNLLRLTDVLDSVCKGIIGLYFLLFY